MIEATFPEGVTSEVAEKLLAFQKRCVVCGASWPLHIHHRLFKSEKEAGVKRFLAKAFPLYKKCYKKELQPWGLHNIQNLVVLCLTCHEGDRVGVHGGNESLRNKLRNSFTCPRTGFNIFYFKRKKYYDQ